MQILDGKKFRDELLEKFKNEIKAESLAIRLDIILVGNDEASDIYVRNKIKHTEYVGIKTVLHRLDEKTTSEDLIDLIEELNRTEEVTGIILQSPTPASIDHMKCASLIDPKKDVDGFTDENVCNLYHNKESLIPCTVKGIIRLLEHYGINLKGKNVTIIGRSEIVGKPLAMALINKDATVTLCHSKTEDLSKHTADADIVISAVGKRNLINSSMVKDGFIGVDVGIAKENGHIYGDFNFDDVADHASYITPVPGGVGPMTIAMIIDNLIAIKKRSIK